MNGVVWNVRLTANWIVDVKTSNTLHENRGCSGAIGQNEMACYQKCISKRGWRFLFDLEFASAYGEIGKFFKHLLKKRRMLRWWRKSHRRQSVTATNLTKHAIETWRTMILLRGTQSKVGLDNISQQKKTSKWVIWYFECWWSFAILFRRTFLWAEVPKHIYYGVLF